MTTKHKRRLMNIQTTIFTDQEEIKPIKTEKLLGIYIQDDLKWNEYIQNNEKSLLRQLSTRLNALRIISNVASFKARLMIGNGIFMSKLIFQISLWGGAEDYLLNSLQVVQNKAARFITKKGKYTPIAELLKQCAWLSVRQSIFYHSVILIYKTLSTTNPKYIYKKLASDFPYNTRLAQSESVRMGSEFHCKLGITERSFMTRATCAYNQLPADLRKIPKVETFKSKLKEWVQENCTI